MNLPFKHSALSIIAGVLAAIIAPAALITPAAWAAKNLIVPDGPYAGERFNPTLTPYLVEPLNAFSDAEAVNKISVRKSAQTGFTLLAIAAVGHSIDCEPCRVMVVEPTDSALAEFNREKLQLAIDQTPALNRKVRPQTSRSTQGSTTYSKRYPGGSLTLAIATSTADLRGKTIKKVIKDEASEYPIDLEGQGSPHGMIEARYESFRATGDWKEINISTPVIKGGCFIDAEFEAGDQRYWHVPCPGCGEEFVFRFGRKSFVFNGEFPFNAHYVTECCGSVIEQHEKNALMRKGRWIALASGPGKHRSYHFDALSSPFVPWDLIAERYLAAKDDPAKLKTFDNLTLGLAHEVRGDAPDHERLMTLREGELVRRQIPPLGLLLTGAADVQGNGIYYEILALAPDRQSFVVDVDFIAGDTSDPESGAFLKLTEVFEREYADSFGGKRRVDVFGVDSGFRSHVVYTWVRGRPNAMALKGGDGWSRPPLGTPSPVDIDFGGRKIKHGSTLWTVGTWSLKAQFYADLRKKRLREGAEIEPPGACHFAQWQDAIYFQQITNEYLADERFKGRTRKVWKERGPNHFLDCRIYNLALADYLGLSRMTSDEWATLAKLRGVPDELRSSDLFTPASVKIAAGEQASAPDRAAPLPPLRRRSKQSPFMG